MKEESSHSELKSSKRGESTPSPSPSPSPDKREQPINIEICQ